jgi:hypothetical protein
MKSKITYLFMLAFNLITYSQVSHCHAELKAELDRNSRSTQNTGTYYKLVISNTGEDKNIFNLTYENNTNDCSNRDGSNISNNIDLKLEFLDLNRKPINQLSLNKGESITFLAHVIVPSGAIPNRWCCSKIIAKSNICQNYAINTVLNTLLTDSNE